jgi:uncharacterized membrane protein YbhN (UPF0104 family)
VALRRILGPRLVAELLLVSTLRYLNLLARFLFAAWAVGAAISSTTIALALPPVMLSFVLGLTPAGLGIVEWGWVGVLALGGVEAEAAGGFALSARAAILLGVLTVNLVAWILYASRRRAERAERAAANGAMAEHAAEAGATDGDRRGGGAA